MSHATCISMCLHEKAHTCSILRLCMQRENPKAKENCVQESEM